MTDTKGACCAPPVEGDGMVWWLILYWPLMAVLIFAGHRAAKRFPDGSVSRHRTDVALGCGVILLPSAPWIYIAVTWLVHRLWN